MVSLRTGSTVSVNNSRLPGFGCFGVLFAAW